MECGSASEAGDGGGIPADRRLEPMVTERSKNKLMTDYVLIYCLLTASSGCVGKSARLGKLKAGLHLLAWHGNDRKMRIAQPV
jgi:hypothetical protein